MDSQKQQAAERIKQANNILVTVSSNPSVDQLAACIGLTISLNKMGKHATAVFSGEVPSTLEFLQPEKTIERTTDSLRDFIIALDKSKADKLRYKVEDRVVKIFITPYRTSITDKDLEFSQGDFNVDVVVALGVHNQAELDQAITAHGRILHDATIISINSKPDGELGGINWLDPNTSSLSELAVQLVNALDKKLIDTQVATAFLTGIVAETERFSNDKTSPQTMSISAELMTSGANQQLVATKLEEPPLPPPPPPPIASQPAAKDEHIAAKEEPKKPNDGTLEIAHDETKRPEEEAALETIQTGVSVPPEVDNEPSAAEAQPSHPPAPQIRIDEHGSLLPADEESDDKDLFGAPKNQAEPSISRHSEPPKMILEPPSLGGDLSANSHPAFNSNDGAGLPGMPTEEGKKPDSMEETGQPSVAPTIMPPAAKDEIEPQNAPGTSFLGDQPLIEDEEKKGNAADKAESVTGEHDTLSDIERKVHSSHLDTMPGPAANTSPPAAAGPQSATRAALPLNPFAPAANDVMLPPVATADAAPPPSPHIPVIPPTAPGPDEALTIPNMPLPSQNTSPPPADGAGSNLDNARDAVAQAVGGSPVQNPGPIQALNAQPVNLPFGSDTAVPPPTPAAAPTSPPPIPEGLSSVAAWPPAPGNNAPPLPPPMMPPTPPPGQG